MSENYTYECPACGEIFNISRMQQKNIQFDRLRCFECRYIFKASEHRLNDDYYACNDKWIVGEGVLHRGYISHVEHLIRSPSSPLVTLFWLFVTLFFFFLLAKQSSVFLLERYAQNETARPYLFVLCQVTGCTLPARSNLYLIRLQDAQIKLGSSQAGALKMLLTLRNEAQYAQGFPPLRITLSDEKNRIVGRRLYQSHEYLEENKRLLPPLQDVRIELELVQPHEKAVSFEVEIDRS